MRYPPSVLPGSSAFTRSIVAGSRLRCHLVRRGEDALHEVALAVALRLGEGERVIAGDLRAVVPLHLAVAHRAGADRGVGRAAGVRELAVEALAQGLLEAEAGSVPV